jgi:hypothetical protein
LQSGETFTVVSPCADTEVIVSGGYSIFTGQQESDLRNLTTVSAAPFENAWRAVVIATGNVDALTLTVFAVCAG